MWGGKTAPSEVCRPILSGVTRGSCALGQEFPPKKCSDDKTFCKKVLMTFFCFFTVFLTFIFGNHHFAPLASPPCYFQRQKSSQISEIFSNLSIFLITFVSETLILRPPCAAPGGGRLPCPLVTPLPILPLRSQLAQFQPFPFQDLGLYTYHCLLS